MEDQSFDKKIHQPKSGPPGGVPLSMLCAICDREVREKALAVLGRWHAYFSLGLLGHGTANSKMLGYLGLGQSEKAIFLAILPTAMARGTLQAMDEELKLEKPGHGIAFMTSIHEGCYHKPVPIAQQREETAMNGQGMYDLIMIIVNRGYTEEVMDTARAAGATGGTVLHARGCGLEGAEKFFGVTIQPEKEVMMIVAGSDASCAIMDAVAQKAGPGTDADAVSFSMPVSGVRGIAPRQGGMRGQA